MATFHLILAPQWVRGVVNGLIWAVLFGMLRAIFDPDQRWQSNVVVALIGGVAIGVLMAIRTQPRHNAYAAVVAKLSRPDRAAAISAASGGGLPSSAVVRAAAASLSRLYVEQQQQRGAANRVAIGLLAACGLGVAILNFVQGHTGRGLEILVVAILIAVAYGWRRYSDDRIATQARLLAGR